MRRIRKATIGVRPLEKMFRISSLAGLMADEVIAARSKAPLDDSYFAQVLRSTNGNSVRVTNEARGNHFIADVEQIVFVQDLYDQDRPFDFDHFFSAFGVLWTAANSVLEVKQVRRIGFVAEYRFDTTSASERLLKTLTKLKTHGHVEKFQLTFESRKGTGLGGLPDPVKDDFFNHIRQIYDSAADADHPQPGAFNANLDVQRYFAPSLVKDVPGAATALRREFEKAVGPFFQELEALGLCDEESS